MRWREVLAASSITFVISAGYALAQTTAPTAPLPPPAAQAEDEDAAPSWQEWRDWMRDWMHGDDDGPRGMRGPRGEGGPGMMWGGGMPMHGGMMPMMMLVMMDTDGNGAVSYEEVEAVHRRMFNLVDEDKNGELSQDEIQAIMDWRSRR